MTTSRNIESVQQDLQTLLAPISVENPCGEWLRYEGTYDQIREARREDDPALPQGVWQAELKRADWEGVESLCTAALANRSKDLQLAVWLLEAWIQLQGFSGAAKGLQLVHDLCAEYWDGMYPPLEADLTPRLSPIRWLNEKLSRRLRLLPLTNPEISGVPAYSLANWDVAMRHPGNVGQASDALTLSKFEQSASVTGYEWFCALKADVAATMEQVRALDKLIDEKAGKDSPGLMKFRAEIEAVEQLADTMLDAARAKLPHPPPEADRESQSEEQEMLASAMIPIEHRAALEASHERMADEPYAGIHSREEAYRMLEEIAEFLYHQDPHSPTPYLIRRAVMWGQMHFDELLPELVKNNGELSDIMRLLKLDQNS